MSQTDFLAAAASVLLLNKLLQNRTLVENQWYQGVGINLDGYTFVNCRFDNCTLTYQSGDFGLNHCYLHNTSVGHSANGVRAVQLFHISHEVAPNEPLAQFWPTRHPDGTISIA